MKRVYSLPLLTAGLLTLAFNMYALSWLVLVALVPYVYFLDLQRTAKRPRVVLTTWLMGLFTSLLICAWLATADTAGWLRTGGITLQIAIFLVWLLLGASLSLGYLVLGLGINYFYKRLDFTRLVIMVLPALWVVSEYARSFMVSIIAYGRGAELGARYNFGVLGLPATATTLGYGSRLVGLFGMTALTVYVNILLYLLLKRRWRPAALITLIVGSLCIIGYRWPKSGQSHLRTAVVQVPADTVRYPDTQSDQLRQVSSRSLDVLVLPEYADFLESATKAQQAAIITTLSEDGVIIYTRHGPKLQGKPTNQTVVVNKQGQILTTQQKSFLVPTGEYLPWIIQIGLKIGGRQRLIDEFQSNIALSPSPTPESPVAIHKAQLGILACSGAITFDGYQALARQGATILINPASLVQFRNSRGFTAQDHQFARFQALSLDRPFLQSSRGSSSWIIDGNGKLLPRTAMVTPQKNMTLVGRMGEWYVWVSGMVIGLAIWRSTGSWRIRRRST